LAVKDFKPDAWQITYDGVSRVQTPRGGIGAIFGATALPGAADALEPGK
jgi:hypothetical protein